MKSTVMNKLLMDAYNKGNTRAIPKTKIDNANNETLGTHAIRLQMLAATLFNYADAHATTGKERDTLIKKATDDFFSVWNPIAAMLGIVPEMSDLTFLFTVGTFKLSKAKDTKDDKGNVTETGKRSIAAVSDTMFQRDIETLAGKKLNGIEWRSGEWNTMSAEKLAKMTERVKKREDARIAADEKATKASERKAKAIERENKAKASAKAAPKKPVTTKATTKAATVKATAVKATSEKADAASVKKEAEKVSVTVTTPATIATTPKMESPDERRLDGTKKNPAA